MKKILNKKGFTLVELLAVIVVLAIVMLIATRAVTRQMNESKGKSLLTQAQALQRDLNNRCILNDGISVAEIEAIVKEDKIFGESENIYPELKGVSEETNVSSSAVVEISLKGTKFSNVIVPSDTNDIKVSKPADGDGDTLKNGTITIPIDCSNY